MDEAAFREAAEGAKVHCPVSQALAAVPEITLDASLAWACGEARSCTSA
jgi:lipoyl-dependent peroxiredoxin